MLDTEENPSKVNQTASHIDRYESPSYRRYVLFMLTIVYAFNFIDRQLLVILQESIKQDMGLSDTQLGLLTGLAFVIFYVTAAIPIARLADRSNRRNIISWAIGIWSFMTAIGGLSLNYFHLLLARIGVGLGEAGCSPPAHSMISDMYPAENRATVISIYSIGVNAGILLGFFFGGILNEFFGWRVAFVVVGLPGIALALWFRLTVAEPIRGKFEKKPIAKEAIPFVEVFKTLFGNKVILHLMLGSSLCAFVGYVGATWTAPFFIRSHGMGTAELGIWLAAAAGVFGGFGTFCSGYLCDKLGVKDKRWYLWLPAICILLVLPCIVFVLLTGEKYQALIIYCAVCFFGSTYLAPSIAMLYSLVDVRMRAVSSAFIYLVLNLVGLGIGATLVGAISDMLAETYGQESLRYAMLYAVPVACVWAATHLLIAARYIRQEALKVGAT